MKGVKQSLYFSRCDAVTHILVRSPYRYDPSGLRDMLYLLFRDGGYPSGCSVTEEDNGCPGHWFYTVEYVADTIEGRFLTPAIVLGFLRQIERDLEEVLKMKKVAGLLRDDDD